MNTEKKIHTADAPAGEFYFCAVRDVADALRKALPTCRVYEGKVHNDIASALRNI